MQKYFNIGAIAIIVLLVFLYYEGCNKNQRLQNENDLYNSLTDTLVKTRNKLNQETSSRKALYSDLQSFKKLNGIKDSAILALQKAVDKNTLTATIIRNTTVAAASGSTDTVLARDTIIKDSLIYIFPEYRKIFRDRWFLAAITANKDTTMLNFKTYNEFIIKHQWKRQDGIFKPKSLIIEVTNLNPNTETTSLQSFVFKPKKQRRMAVFAGGVAIGAAVVLFLTQ